MKSSVKTISRVITWKNEPPPRARCGSCDGELADRHAIATVEDEHNFFRLTLCAHCATKAEALFAIGANFPGLELN